ncbi:MerR family transcriptional regulator [Rhodococcus sp. KBW08]|uniref:MerR family transcriptional regulator n=1 Tax=Rhodococcus sp. KBW08 TaxID=2144188 RepID=UPI000F59AB37|nr:MerR family transcriptional regulator [Rhodococcus sp. KBW08]RQO50235.1 MerR family transcriptional regulator [Rhodococcus sp. KBW08]
MKIGELSEATRVSRRLLRYYEEQSLIAPRRSENSYRDYDERMVDRVFQIRGLLDMGFPTRVIRQILPCLDQERVIHMSDVTPEMLSMLEAEASGLDDKISFLVKNRDAIREYIAEVRQRQTVPLDG